MTKFPQFLKKGDTVAIVCPAGKVSRDLSYAIHLFESWGLNVLKGKTLSAGFHQFAGNDKLRIEDFQTMLDNPTVKAIFAARGGYGTVRIIDRIDFSGFVKCPKWIIGFSDITVLHSHIQAQFGIPTIHGQMPQTVAGATKASLESLRKALFGKRLSYHYKSRYNTRSGFAKGVLVGGNLATLISIAGSVSEVDYRGKILFIEDVGEYMYCIDRMLRMLKRAGKLRDLNGLILGGFTDMKENKIPFGYTPEEIIFDLVKDYDFPVATNFPAGHLDNNKTLIFGKNILLSVSGQSVSLAY